MLDFSRPSGFIDWLPFRSHCLQEDVTGIINRCDLVAPNIDYLPVRLFMKSSVRNSRGHVLHVREGTGLISLTVYERRLVSQDPNYPYSKNIPIWVRRILSRAIHIVW